MRYLSDIKSLISFLLSNPSHHVLVLSGPPGWAKTASTREILGELGIRYELMGAYATAFALYNKLAAGSNGEGPALYVFDDTAGVLSSPQALSILNAASWPSADQDNQRRVQWTSTTEKAEAPFFNFTSKILILTNYMTTLPQAQAFVNRALNYAIEIRAEDIQALFLEAVRSQKHFPDSELALAVAHFVAEQAKAFEPGKISLRDLSRAYDMATHFQAPAVWQPLFVKTLPQRGASDLSPEKVVLELHQSGKKVGEQVQIFCSKTGLGERKFYYIRGQLGLHSEAKSQAAKVVALARTKSKPAKAKPRIVKREVEYVAD